MSSVDEENEKFIKDKRVLCKYGVECYQKNPNHLSKFKHPPQAKKLKQMKLNGDGSIAKKRKIDDNKVDKIFYQSQSTSCNDNTNSNNNNKMDDPSIEPQTIIKVDKSGFIKSKFLVEMPNDFYDFWSFCQYLNQEQPENALLKVNLKLVGPFDVLAGKFENVSKKSEADYLTHWRYYYDIPEFQTVLKGDDKTGFHIGYFRDSPKDLPVFLASNHGMKDGVINCMGENIFAAVYNYMEDFSKIYNPFMKVNVVELMKKVKKESEKLKLNLGKFTGNTRSRQTKIRSRTFNNIGLVVPYDKKTQQGYRPLATSDKELKELLDKIMKALPEQRSKFLSELQTTITWADVAIDECDFGTGIELGWDIICHGIDCLNTTALRFLKTCYDFLNRKEFAIIAEAHLNNRKKSCNLSIL